MKIAIITMHKVLNYGSALQAYALQNILFKLGFDNELINYLFEKKSDKSLKEKIVHSVCVIRDFFRGNPITIKHQRFELFYKNYFKETVTQYHSEVELKSIGEKYDCYITGSDQVWNPIHIADDTSYLLSFVGDGKKKISYASSFSVGLLPDKYKESFRKYLKLYSDISVREFSGVSIVKELLNSDVTVTCDPTLLVESETWKTMAQSIPQLVKGNYILVYILKYAYDPFPNINSIIDDIALKLGLPVVSIDTPYGLDIESELRHIRNAGPLEFLSLFANASFVITTSFHGTAFSLNFKKDFISVVSDNQQFDTRMRDLLKIVGAEERMVVYNDYCDINTSIDYNEISLKLHDFRNASLFFLQKSLNN